MNAKGIPPAAQQVLAMLLCLVGGRVTPSQVWRETRSQGGGYPNPRGVPQQGLNGGGGYPIPGWGGYPGHVWIMGGTPSKGGGYPSQVLMVGGTQPSLDVGGYPPHHPDLARGVPQVSPIIKTWPGYPPPSRPGWGSTPGTPIIKTWLGYLLGWGTPHHPDLDGVPPTPGMGIPHPRPGMEYPPPSRPGWGTPPDLRWGTAHHPDLDGVPPPPPEMLTDRHLWKQYLPVILRMRAVIT